jgi:hypothetical protein
VSIFLSGKHQPRPFGAFTVEYAHTLPSDFMFEGYRYVTRLSWGVEWEPWRWTQLRCAVGGGVDYVSFRGMGQGATPGGRAQLTLVIPTPLEGLEFVGALAADLVTRGSGSIDRSVQPVGSAGAGWRW